MKIKKLAKTLLFISLISINFTINTVSAQNLKTEQKPDKKNQLSPNKKLFPDINLEIKEENRNLSLAECLKIALEENFDIKSITADKDRQKWLYRGQLATFLPDITADYLYTRFNGVLLVGNVLEVSETGKSVNMGLNANVDIFKGFKRIYDTKTFKNLYKSAIKKTDKTVNQVLLDTATQYYRLLQVKYNIKVFQSSLESVKEQLKINQEQLEAGTGTKFDVLRAEAEVASFSQLLINAQNNYRLAQAQLSQTMGINVFTLINPLESEIEQKNLFKKCLNLDELVTTALKNQPDIDIAQYDLNATRAIRNSAYSNYLPTISIRQRDAEVGFDNFHLGHNQTRQVVATWTGGTNLGLKTFSDIKAFNQEIKKSEINKIITIRQVQQSVLAAYNRVITEKAIITAAEKEVASANESLRLSLVRQRAGVGLYVDVLNAQSTQNTAMVKYLNALSDYNIFQSQLLYEIGLISVNNLIDGFEPPKEQKKK
jgi:outer membrane protein TolC